MLAHRNALIDTIDDVASLATVDLIMYLSFPRTSYYVTVALVNGKMYSNMLMVLFNSRIRILGSRASKSVSEEGYNMNGINPQSVRLPDGSAGGRRVARNTPIALSGIRVEEQTWIHTDQRNVAAEEEEQVRYFLCLLALAPS